MGQAISEEAERELFSKKSTWKIDESGQKAPVLGGQLEPSGPKGRVDSYQTWVGSFDIYLSDTPHRVNVSSRQLEIKDLPGLGGLKRLLEDGVIDIEHGTFTFTSTPRGLITRCFTGRALPRCTPRSTPWTSTAS
jgi:hypothetical protein